MLSKNADTKPRPSAVHSDGAGKESTGIIDAIDSDVFSIVGFKFHEQAKHLTLTGHWFLPKAVRVNAAWLDSLPEDLRAMATEAARAAHVGAAKHALDPNGAYDSDRLRTLFRIHHHLEAAAGSLESINTALRDQGARDRARKMDMAA